MRHRRIRADDEVRGSDGADYLQEGELHRLPACISSDANADGQLRGHPDQHDRRARETLSNTRKHRNVALRRPPTFRMTDREIHENARPS